MKKTFLIIISILCIASQANAELHYDAKAKVYVPDDQAKHTEAPQNCLLFGEVAGLEDPYLPVTGRPSKKSNEIGALFERDIVCVTSRSNEWKDWDSRM
jgi:hypothetical protein